MAERESKLKYRNNIEKSSQATNFLLKEGKITKPSQLFNHIAKMSPLIDNNPL
jgi:hypothetical protein